MKKGLMAIAIVAFIAVIAVFWYTSTRNRIITLDETVKESWSQVENVYQRRSDLIPNLVSTVKGYAAHERDTLQAVVEARSKVGQVNAQGLENVINSPESFERFQQAQDSLSSALSRLMVVVERYPDLKANQNFLELQAQLEGTENRIAVERRRFNETVKTYNVAVRRFPGSVVAGMSGFQPRPFFQSQAGADVAPKVEF